jgi:uncharacterized membrane protein YfhO
VLEEARGFLQGVKLGAGAHRVELRYQPVSLYLGMAALAVAVACAWRLTRLGI